MDSLSQLAYVWFEIEHHYLVKQSQGSWHYFRILKLRAVYESIRVTYVTLYFCGDIFLNLWWSGICVQYAHECVDTENYPCILNMMLLIVSYLFYLRCWSSYPLLPLMWLFLIDVYGLLKLLENFLWNLVLASSSPLSGHQHPLEENLVPFGPFEGLIFLVDCFLGQNFHYWLSNRKGMYLPNICLLSYGDGESVYHTLIQCHFITEVWNAMVQDFGLSWVMSLDIPTLPSSWWTSALNPNL